MSATEPDLVRGEERRYNAPLLTPGTRLLLPADVKAVPVLNYYRRPRLAPAASAWPQCLITSTTRQTNGWTSATPTASPGPATVVARARYSG